MSGERSETPRGRNGPWLVSAAVHRACDLKRLIKTRVCYPEVAQILAFPAHSSALFTQEVILRVCETRFNVHVQFGLVFKFWESSFCVFGAHRHSSDQRRAGTAVLAAQRLRREGRLFSRVRGGSSAPL